MGQRDPVIRWPMIKVVIEDGDVQRAIDAYRVLTDECNSPRCLGNTKKNEENVLFLFSSVLLTPVC